MPMRRWEWGNDAGIEQRRSGRAIGYSKALSGRAGPGGHSLLDHAVGLREALLGVGNAAAIAFARRAKAVGDDLLHGKLDVEVEEAIPKTGVEVLCFLFREKSLRAATMPIEIFDDDRCFRNHPVRHVIVEDGYLADRPQAEKAGAGVLISEIDDMRHKGGRVFIKRDQDLVTKGGQGVIVKGKRHRIPAAMFELFRRNNNENITALRAFCS